MRKKLFLKKTMSLALVAAMALTVSPTTTFAATNVKQKLAHMQQKTMKHISMFMQVLLGVNTGRVKECMRQNKFSHQTNLTAVRNSIRVALMQ